VYRMLEEEFGIDFTHYKPSTITRRIERRLQLARVEDIDEYVRKLQSEHKELDTLYRDLLIGVTRFFRNEEAKQTFLKGMHGLGVLSSPKVVGAFDLSRFQKLADLGGATGHLAITACERYPDLHAVVFDLPQVIEAARTQVAKSMAARHIQLLSGDFFRDELPEADLFAMSRIVHDWPEDKISALLAKIYQRLPANGGVLLAEKLLNEDKSGPTSAQMQSLNMLVCTEGKERTLGEYRKLLQAAGFQNVQGRMTGSPLDAVLAIKP